MDDFFEVGADYNAADADARAASGGMIPPGLYPATLTGAKNKEAKTGNEGKELTFTIKGGPFDGRDVEKTLWKPGDKDFLRDQLIRFGGRLGLFARDPKTGEVKVENGRPVMAKDRTDFLDCLDKEVVIEVMHEKDREDPEKKWVRVAPFGIWDPAHPHDKEGLAKERAKGQGGKAAAGKGAAASGGKATGAGAAGAAATTPAKGGKAKAAADGL